MEQLPVRIRDQRDGDGDAVRQVVTAAFGRADEAVLVDLLRADASAPSLCLVAESGGRIVGFVCFSPVRVGEVELAGLAPVAVTPDLQRNGVGAALIRAGFERCPAFGWRAVFLVGDPGYYGRFGFVLAAPLGFSYGDPYFDRALQVIELQAGALRGLAGRVRFSPAFEQSGTG